MVTYDSQRVLGSHFKKEIDLVHVLRNNQDYKGLGRRGKKEDWLNSLWLPRKGSTARRYVKCLYVLYMKSCHVQNYSKLFNSTGKEMMDLNYKEVGFTWISY